ncbi:hypothetical protein AgCh_031938 [Apium graveolens]
MQSRYEMSMMGELKFLLGHQVNQKPYGIFIFQMKYIKDLLKKYKLEDSTPAKTPVATAIKLDQDKSGKKFQANLKESHLIAVKRIFRYMKGTPNLDQCTKHQHIIKELIQLNRKNVFDTTIGDKREIILSQEPFLVVTGWKGRRLQVLRKYSKEILMPYGRRLEDSKILLRQNSTPVVVEVVAESTTATGLRIPSSSTLRDPSKYTEIDKELINLYTSLQLIIVESNDNDMSHQLLGSNSAKDMWETIELLMEGAVFNSFECSDYQNEALIEPVMLTPKSSPEDWTKNPVRTAGVTAGIDFTGIGEPAGNCKSTTLAKNTAPVVHEPETQEVKVSLSSTIKEIVVAEIAHGEPEDESEFYTQEELEQLEDKSMAYMAAKFSHVRFKRKPNYKPRGSSGRFQKGNYSSGSSSRGGYKSSWVDKSKTRCYNCNELGHFASDCRNPKAAKGKDFYEKKETYEDLKRQN